MQSKLVSLSQMKIVHIMIGNHWEYVVYQ